MEDLGFDFVWSRGWRNSWSSHLPVWKKSEESDSFCQQKKKEKEEKWKRRGVTREMVGGREGGRTGRHCVLSSPFYSFTLVPFWPLGGMVTKEGVRNVLLLKGCHLRTERSFVCCVLYEEEWIQSTGTYSEQQSPLNIGSFSILKRLLQLNELYMVQQCQQRQWYCRDLISLEP